MHPQQQQQGLPGAVVARLKHELVELLRQARVRVRVRIRVGVRVRLMELGAWLTHTISACISALPRSSSGSTFGEGSVRLR